MVKLDDIDSFLNSLSVVAENVPETKLFYGTTDEVALINQVL